MSAVSLFLDTNMAALMSRENQEYIYQNTRYFNPFIHLFRTCIYRFSYLHLYRLSYCKPLTPNLVAVVVVVVTFFKLIIVIVFSRYMFWTDWGYMDPKIERADLSGENRRVLRNLGAYWYHKYFPMSVVIDYDAERIYWMDAYDNYIDTTDVNGSNVGTIHYIGENIFPADLALYGNNLYWADWNSQSIQWFNTTQPLLMFNFGHLTDVYLTGAVVAHESRQPIGNYMLSINLDLWL